MAISPTLQRHLEDHQVSFDVLAHERTLHSLATAKAGSVPEDNLAKAILIRKQDGFLLAIVPASRNVALDALGRWLKQPVCLATEEDVAAIFDDCEPGAVPPIADAFGLPAVMDEHLEGLSHIYFEGGDHCTLVHLRGGDFRRLTARTPHAPIGTPIH
jgi:Ala-tRNA(Pro) deacylase